MISIIGSGRVGSAVAFLIASEGLDNITLLNKTKSKAFGEALDLANAIPRNSPMQITGTDNYDDVKDSDVVIITASAAIYQNSRTEMLSEQKLMIKSIQKKLKENSPNSKFLMVSNPLDVLTYLFQKDYFPSQQVIGVASSLDSARFRLLLARELNVNQSEIKGAAVLGEHGDSMVPVFSLAKKGEIPVLELLKDVQVQKITTDLKNYWKILRAHKSRSVFGIAKNVYDIVKALKTKSEFSIPAAVLLEGQYGINDVCMGVPITISSDGTQKIQEINLANSELLALKQSSEAIRKFLV